VFDTGATQVRLVAEPAVIVSQLIQGNFPNYTKLIPAPAPSVIEAQAEEMRQAVKGLKRLTDASGIVRLVADENGVTLSAKEEMLGEQAVRLAHATLRGDACKVAVDAKFLADALASCDGETVQIGIRPTSAPITFESPAHPDWIEVVMPMFVEW
jgi:DNA polymerase-3 subunit beta